MANMKSSLFVFFMLAILIGQSGASALQVNTSIDQAIALINKTIDESLARVDEVIEEHFAQAEEAIDEALARIKAAIDEAIALIEEAIDEDLAQAEEAINKDIQEAAETLASRLTEAELMFSLDEATELIEMDFTGLIAAGMASAYELIGDNTYKTFAEIVGENILSTALGDFTGDEVFALARLSQISSTPHENLWRTVVSDFYRDVQNGIDGTEGYLRQFAEASPSTAVFHLAYYVIGAYYVDAEDKEIFRCKLINYLSQVDDDCSDSPVMALGIATWALALTGALDDTLIDLSGTGAACWNHKKLKDLPELLLSLQVPDGEPYAGSFYRRFDCGDGGTGGFLCGYTEDAIFATLGLIGVFRDDPALDLEAAILASQRAILDAIDGTGSLCHHREIECSDCYQIHAAEMLQVLGELIWDSRPETQDPRLKLPITSCQLPAQGKEQEE